MFASRGTRIGLRQQQHEITARLSSCNAQRQRARVRADEAPHRTSEKIRSLSEHTFAQHTWCAGPCARHAAQLGAVSVAYRTAHPCALPHRLARRGSFARDQPKRGTQPALRAALRLCDDVRRGI